MQKQLEKSRKRRASFTFLIILYIINILVELNLSFFLEIKKAFHNIKAIYIFVLVK